jgi:hypothetical protein
MPGDGAISNKEVIAMKAEDVKHGVEIMKLLSDIIGAWVDRRRQRREKEDERDERLKKLEAELALLRAERCLPSNSVLASDS